MQHFGLRTLMRQSFSLFLAIFFLFAAPVHAETVKIGSVSVEYSIPKGYVLASGEAYDPFYKLMHDGLPDFTIHAIYVPKSVDHVMQTSGGDALAQYMTVMHINKLENASFSEQDFEKVRQSFRQDQTGDVDGAIQERMRQVFEKQGMDVNLSSVTIPLGIIEESATHISTLALLKQRVESGEDKIDITQAVVTRLVLGDGKLVQLSLYKSVENEAEATFFQTEALAVLDSMNFKESAAWGIPPAWRNVGLQVLILGVMGSFVVVALLVLKFRKKRR